MALPMQSIKHIVPVLFIGLLGFALATLLHVYGGLVFYRAQIETSDILMVRSDGTRFGARAASSDIVLVLFDQKTADEVGYVHSYSRDLELYKSLVGMGAIIVFDTRMVAAASQEAFVEIGPLLEGMLALHEKAFVKRDVWLSSEIQTQTQSKYASCITPNIINSHPQALPNVTSRLYPIAHFSSNSVLETAPLTICRYFLSIQPVTSLEVGEELRRSGIMSKWHELAPNVVPKTEVVRSPYRLGSREIVWHPFLPASMLVPPAAFWVSYDPPMDGFQRQSYIDALNKKDAAGIKGKIVIVGYSPAIDPTSDTYVVPNLPGKASAAEVLACATQTLLDGRNQNVIPWAANLIAAALMTVGLALVGGIAKPLQATIFALSAIVLYYVFAIFAYRSGWYPDFILIPACSLLSVVPAGAFNAWLSLRSRQRVVDLFGRYVPRAIVNQLIQRSQLESLTMGGVNRDVSVMFADIRGFTVFSQDMAPQNVVLQLNSLLEIMVNCTFESEGTLDKFIGDAILVLFNVPLDQPDHVERAVRTAISIQQRLTSHYSGLQVGIGIHRGEAVVGNIGTPQRMEYTAIGSTVNIASRLCDLALPGEVVVSQAIVDSLPKLWNVKSKGTVQVKGIKKPLEVFCVEAIESK